MVKRTRDNEAKGSDTQGDLESLLVAVMYQSARRHALPREPHHAHKRAGLQSHLHRTKPPGLLVKRM
jgi:hypothetical protein